MNHHSTALALQRTVSDIVNEYDQKVAAAGAAVSAFEGAVQDIQSAGCIMGVYTGPVLSGSVSADERVLKRRLLESGWKAIYQRLSLDRIATAADKRRFDHELKDPPFAGRHYVKHVRHALKFLRPRGVLVSVLPASSYYDHKELEGEWHDLPVASFAESGTNIPTGYLVVRA